MAIRKEPGKSLKEVVVLSSSFWQISYFIIKKEILKTQNIKCKHLLPVSDHYLTICSTWNFPSRFISLMTKIKKAAWKILFPISSGFLSAASESCRYTFWVGGWLMGYDTKLSWGMTQNWLWFLLHISWESPFFWASNAGKEQGGCQFFARRIEKGRKWQSNSWRGRVIHYKR